MMHNPHSSALAAFSYKWSDPKHTQQELAKGVTMQTVL